MKEYDSHVYVRAGIIPGTNDSLAMVAARVPDNAEVLDVGCSVGMLGKFLSETKGCEVDGIEANPRAVMAARPFYRRLSTIDLEDMIATKLAIRDIRYDRIVCADILEHLRDPRQILRLLSGHLNNDGAIIASIPNIGHAGVILEILSGDFCYRDEGLLDRTHLRFFTRKSFLRLLEESGLHGAVVDRTVLPIEHCEFSGVVSRLPEWVNRSNVADNLLRFHSDAATYQLIVEAKPKDKAPTHVGLLSSVDEGVEDITTTSIGMQAFVDDFHGAPEPVQHRDIAIIICVHNALGDVRRCIDSVVRHTSRPYELVVVDDGSDATTRDWLRDNSPRCGARLLRNSRATGYTRAANVGMQAATGEDFVLLNSDTIVSPGWLDRMYTCLESDPRIGIVGPLSNTASWQSVPDLFSEEGDWAKNALPVDLDVDRMGRLVAAVSARVYPELPFLNGFCLLIRREVREDIGGFDESRFGDGYGEENDYCVRARYRGWKLAVADDAYVYHEQARSYTDERRKVLCERAALQLASKYDHEKEILPAIRQCRDDRVMHGIRVRVAAALERQRLIESMRGTYAGMRIAIVLPIGVLAGGGHVILQEARSLAAMGVSVRILNLECNRQAFLQSYSVDGLDLLFLRDPSAIAQEAFRADVPYDVAMATTNFCVSWLEGPPPDGPAIVYYVQDYEPDFFLVGSAEREQALRSYTLIPGARIVTKTAWNSAKLKTGHGVDATVLGPSVDLDLFRPRPRIHSDAVRVCAMVRPGTPYRGPDRTLRVVEALRERFGSAVEIHTFGCSDPELGALAARCGINAASLHHHGVLTHAQVSEVLNECEIFMDFSHFQAMGLTALESMACGNAVIVPSEGGACEFVRHEENGLVIDSKDEAGCVQACERLVRDVSLRARLSAAALEDAAGYPAEVAVAKLLRSLGQGEAALNNPESVSVAEGRPAALEKVELCAVAGGADGWRGRARTEGFYGERNSAGLDGVATDRAPNRGATGEQGRAYRQWCNIFGLHESDGQVMAERMMQRWRLQPVIHLIVVLRRGEGARLAATLDSLSIQLYAGWGLTVLAGEPCPDPLFTQIPNVEWRESKEDSTAALNAIVGETESDWVGLLRPGDRLAQHALFACADRLQGMDGARLLYTDWDRLDEAGDRFDPRFERDMDLDWLRTGECLGGLWLIRRDALLELGGFGGRGAEEARDVALRLFECFGSETFGHVDEVLCHRPASSRAAEEGADTDSHRAVLAAHLRRVGESGEIAEGLVPGTLRVRYPVRGEPSVSLIVDTTDDLRVFEQFVETLRAVTKYPKLELVVVDCGSRDEDTHEYFDALRATGAVVVSAREGVGRAEAWNTGARAARGEYLVFADRRTGFVQKDWVEILLGHAQREGVGIVAPRIVGADSTLVHSALILGFGGPAKDAFQGLSAGDPGYGGRALTEQGCSAVPPGCLMVRRACFEAVEGFDAERFSSDWFTVDFCLRSTAAGYRTIWTPYALVGWQVPEPARETGDPEQEAAAYERWLPQLAHDPFYHRNLDLSGAVFQPRVEATARWNPVFHEHPRILGVPADTFGCGEYRILAPLNALDAAARAHCGLLAPQEGSPRMPSVTELARLAPDTLLLQSAIDDVHLAALRRYRRFNQVFRVFDMEDLKTNVPEKNSRRPFLFRNIKARTRQALSLCDRLIVTTEPLAEAHRRLIDDIRVVPIYLARDRWGALTPAGNESGRPRVGWAGGQQHEGDLEILLPIVQAMAGEVDWVFLGMCPEALRPYVKEVHDMVPFAGYPARLASLALDLAVAPLEEHPFNVAKTNLRLLEYGILGWPIVCTDIEPYRGAPVMRVPNDPVRWIEAIRERVNDLDAARAEGARLREWVLGGWMLEDHLDEWLDALSPSEGTGAVVVGQPQRISDVRGS